MRARDILNFDEEKAALAYSLYSTGKINEVIEEFRKLGLVYEKWDALLKATALGLEQDRCHRQITGEPTYRLAGYCLSSRKFRRGFRSDRGYFSARSYCDDTGCPRRHQALGYDPEKKGQSRYSSICDAASGWGAGKDVQAACEFRYARRIDR